MIRKIFLIVVGIAVIGVLFNLSGGIVPILQGEKSLFVILIKGSILIGTILSIAINIKNIVASITTK